MKFAPSSSVMVDNQQWLELYSLGIGYSLSTRISFLDASRREYRLGRGLGCFPSFTAFSHLSEIRRSMALPKMVDGSSG